jgi:hypothetical protein
LATKATAFRIILWRCWAQPEHGIAHLDTAAGTAKIQQATAPVKGLLSSPIPTEIAREIRSLVDPVRTSDVPPGAPSVLRFHTPTTPRASKPMRADPGFAAGD